MWFWKNKIEELKTAVLLENIAGNISFVIILFGYYYIIIFLLYVTTFWLKIAR